MIGAPDGWVIDRETGKRLGVCCVYYPQGTTWDTAETVMYPNVATKEPGQATLREFMEHDLADFREHNPQMTFEDGEEVTLGHGRSAKIRYFYNVNGGSSEAIAYVDEGKIIGLLVMSSKTSNGLKASIPLFRSALQTYIYMDVRFGNEKPKPAPLPK
jgi:hypothetical protein